MNCRKVRQDLFGYFKQELSQEESKIIQAHLDSCPDCAKEAEEVREMSLLVKDGFETLSPSADFNERLLERIQSIPSERVEARGKRNWWVELLHEVFPSIKLRWAMVGTASVLVLALAFMLVQKRATFEPQSISQDTNKKSQTLVSSEDMGDSAYQMLLEKLAESSAMRNKTFVIDNFTFSPNRGEDGRIRLDDLHKRFVIEKDLYPTGRRGNYYVLPVVSTQPVSQKIDY